MNTGKSFGPTWDFSEVVNMLENARLINVHYIKFVPIFSANC